MAKYPIRLIINKDGSRFEQHPFTVDEQGKSTKQILLDIIKELERLRGENHLNFDQIDDLMMQAEVNSVKEASRGGYGSALSKDLRDKRNELTKIKNKYKSDIKIDKFKEVIEDALFYIRRFTYQLKA